MCGVYFLIVQLNHVYFVHRCLWKEWTSLMEGERNESGHMQYIFRSCNDTFSTRIDCAYLPAVNNSSSPLCAIKSTFIVTLSVFTVFSNAVLLHLIRSNKTLQTTGNLYIVSLAVSDLLVGLLVILPNVYDVCVVNSPWGSLHWSHGMWVTADFYFTSESILHYVLFNLNRFWSINAPFKYLRKRSRRKTIMHIAATWGIGIVTIISPAITWNLGFKNLLVPSKTVFVEFKQSAWLMFANAVLIYFIPFFVLCAIYGKIFRALSERSKLGVGRTSISSTVFSNKNPSSRRGSEHITSQPFITESELERLRGIYDRALKREQSERQLKVLFPRRKRLYNASGGELKRYDSIEEEDDTQENNDSPTKEPPDGFINIRRREPIIGFFNEKQRINGIREDILAKKPVNCDDRHEKMCNGFGQPSNGLNNDTKRLYNLIENEGDVRINSCQCRSLTKNDTCVEVLNSRSTPDTTIQSPCLSEICSNEKPRRLRMAKVEQMKKFGGIVCPSCSQMFTRVGLIHDSDLQGEDNSLDISADVKSYKNERSTSFSISEESNGEVKSHLLPKSNLKDDLNQILNNKCVPCVDIPLPKGDSALRRVSLENGREKPTESVLNNFPDRSRRFSHPAILTSMEPTQHRNSIGDITTRVRQSFQNSFSAISGKSSRALNVIKQQEKAAKQLGITLSCLFVCWTPYFLQVLIYSISPQSAHKSLMTISVYLGYSHSLCNPILIIIFNLKIQRAFTKSMRYFPKQKTKGLFASQPSAL